VADETQVIEGLPGFATRAPDGTITNAAPALAAAEPFTRKVEDLSASISYDLDSGISFACGAATCSTTATSGDLRLPGAAARHLG
jgi:hypothetical protein